MQQDTDNKKLKEANDRIDLPDASISMQLPPISEVPR
jgi:hypothetical protein